MTDVVGARSGLELISISHGVKSSVSIKSAPYSSKLFCLLSMVSWHANIAPIKHCLIPGYIFSSHNSYFPICLQIPNKVVSKYIIVEIIQGVLYFSFLPEICFESMAIPHILIRQSFVSLTSVFIFRLDCIVRQMNRFMVVR